ncbi:HlyD family efflux transporter periplasmic adaptor subunit [Halanaerobium congolense]|jgi:putative membrane fusion protein|uniref:Putative membrane fusion protein n=1 Tax=Halanaerobium congolense TaxID=54121 RepID=A0A1G6HMY3_9FIRM|nr:HlyD family efflux transporter periplasmic adaptor subunit [Halanaerobium congolense]PXV69983.1 putative membrane fusion protein [Halanaerobium congolense]TDP26950.1 putative membrane fusion protein [Halanaerobium congolense]TDS33097.1 putative membrane fusion protein [Halanaerobium congolense]SDB95255.1 putative membrane fusion protein [Halanaerobium congolense]SDH66002.1 putative membrane fusion protein [Halanaerobium congolense]
MAKKKNISFKPFVLIFILIITLIIGIQIFGAARFESVLAAQGEVIDGFWSDVLIVRDEILINSPITGRVELLVGEGDRLASGEKLAVIKSSAQSQKIFNKKAGIVSFAVDGLESRLNPNSLNQINLNNFDELQGNYKHLLSGDRIKKEESLYRIINNFKLYLLAEVPESQSDRFNIGELIFLEEKNTKKLYEARITNIRHNLEKTFFQIKVEQFIPQWINRRRIELNIIKNIYRGIKIPRKAVFNQLSGQGVLKVTGYNKYEFQEVFILNGNEEYVIVSGLEIGEEIITNPEDFDYGREA